MRTAASSPRHDAVSTGRVRRAWREVPFSMLLSTGLGVGFSPAAPGTAGSLLGLGLAWSLASAFSPGTRMSVAGGVGLLMSGLLLAAVAVPLATRVCRALEAKDPGCVVLDEVAGQLLASAAVPLFRYASPSMEACAWIASFLAFRLMDIWKPGPIGRLQELPEGLGIVADDVLAGAFALAATALVAGFLAKQPPWIS